MSKTVKFKPKVSGDSLKLEKSEIEDVIRVNQACSDLVLTGGEKIRVKSSYSKTLEKLGQKAQPGGLERIGEDDTLRRDKKLKNFFN